MPPRSALPQPISCSVDSALPVKNVAMTVQVDSSPAEVDAIREHYKYHYIIVSRKYYSSINSTVDSSRAALSC